VICCHRCVGLCSLPSVLSILAAGHTSESLVAVGGEIVVTFEGHSELGDAFMTRRSYLPNEIHWGCK
jgi:hypothetical protein